MPAPTSIPKACPELTADAIDWRVVDGANVAPPTAAGRLLEQAIAGNPSSAALRLKLAGLQLDRFDFAGAADTLAEALALDPTSIRARRELARCNNALGRHRQALECIEPIEASEHERAVALLALGHDAEAETEWRAVLAADPQHRQACRQLARLLRRSGRTEEMLELCEALAARGASHAQLFYSWGAALAFAGEHERARALLLDPARIAEANLPVPDNFGGVAEFNAALAEELLGNPHRLSDFPLAEEANRGSSRVHALFAGRRPELVRGLLQALQTVVQTWLPKRYGDFDPWLDARPAGARIRAWGLIQRGEAYEEWHLHRGGWLSGVYYIRLPRAVAASGDGRGCIEFGPPTALERALPGYALVVRKQPREGMLLLAPSQYAHRTIPSGVDEDRISFAFDVVPDREGGA